MKVALPRTTAADEELNMAPMIDMVFLLLIFFMVASHLKQLESVEIEVPIAENAVVPKELSDRRVVSIKADGTIYLGGAPQPLEKVKPIVEKARQQIPDLKIYLRADKRVEHKKVREVMKACADAGASEILFATYESE